MATSSDREQQTLAEVMREVPRGALALAAFTVALLLIVWLIVYVFVFLPRGMVS
ncbi:MAG: cytochrome c oxidase subunit 2A [Gemmatimonas sp.]